MPRVNIKISDKTKLFFEQLSRDTGGSQSSLMSLALTEYINSKKGNKV